MENVIVKMTRASLAFMLIAWLATPALAQGCDDWIIESSEDWEEAAEYWQAVTPEEVQTCLNDGADVHAGYGEGGTPLHFAASNSKNPKVILTLLAAGADVDARDRYLLSPLHWAGGNENLEIIMTLLEAGADVDTQNREWLTPLYWAAAYNENPAVLMALLEAGADVNMSTLSERELLAIGGTTPLHWAAQQNNNPEIIMILLKAGANAKAKDSYDNTPFDYAKENEALKNTKAYWALNDAQF